jgi:cytochrome P450
MTASTPVSRYGADPIADVDLADPDPRHATAIDSLLADLRGCDAVFWHGPKSRSGFWAVIRYAEAVQVYRDATTFSAAHGMTLDSLRAGKDPASGMMVEVTDPPEHRRLRRSVGTVFADGVVGAIEPVVNRNVRGLVAAIRATDGPVDAVAALAAPVPTHAAGMLLGLPEHDLDWITGRTAQVFLSDERAGDHGELRAAADKANNELLAYFAKLLRCGPRAVAGGAPPRGLVARLAAGSEKRAGLTTGEAVLNALNLAIGGTTTTRSLLTNLLRAMSEQPGILAALAEDPALVPTAVEEAARWANPVRHLARVATRDVELGGRMIKAGDPVLVWPRSANRDSAVFERAEEFDVHRYPNPHIGFAAGPHSCPGTGLARIQVRAVLVRLVESFSACEPAGPPELMRSNFLHGHARLPLRFTPR